MSRLSVLIFLILLFLLFPMLCPFNALADSEYDSDSPQELIDTTELQSFLREIGSEYGQLLGNIDLEDWLSPKGGRDENDNAAGAGLVGKILRLVLNELAANASLMGQLIVLAVLSAVLTNLGRGFMDEGISGLSGTLCYFVLMLIGINSFRMAASIAADAVESMAAFMYALMPTVFALLVSMGGSVSSALLHPIVYMAISSFIFIVKEIVLPLALIGTVMTVMSRMSERFQISKMAALITSLGGTVMKLAFVVFLGVASIRGVAAAVGDGIAIRAGKFAVGNFVPVFGGLLSESYEVIAGTSLALKSSIGMMGAFVLFIISIYPAVKILAILLMYKIAGAVIQPLGEARFSETMNDLGNSLSVILLAVAATGITFFSAMAVVIGIGSISMMLR